MVVRDDHLPAIRKTTYDTTIASSSTAACAPQREGTLTCCTYDLGPQKSRKKNNPIPPWLRDRKKGRRR